MNVAFLFYKMGVTMEKQSKSKLDFYTVDKNYLSFLHDRDEEINGSSCVPKMNSTQKEMFSCGVLVNVSGVNYLAPISSCTIKNDNNILLYSKDNQVSSSIRFNYMIPLAQGTYKKCEFEQDSDSKYLGVVKQEWLSANQQADRIIKLAKSTYCEVCSFIEKGGRPKWACNFICLEQLSKEWDSKMHSQS